MTTYQELLEKLTLACAEDNFSNPQPEVRLENGTNLWEAATHSYYWKRLVLQFKQIGWEATAFFCADASILVRFSEERQ